jgi:hypothetical protein
MASRRTQSCARRSLIRPNGGAKGALRHETWAKVLLRAM